MRQTSQWPLVGELDPASPTSESYRSICASIRFALGDESGRAICVTSSLASEGKSLTAANLAVALAKEGRKTLLIDADLTKPVLHRIFHADNRQGLGFALSNPEKWEQAVEQTPIGSLSLIPAGPIHPGLTAFLTADAFRELLREAKNRFDFVILDTPAILPHADARIAAALSDGVILVVGSGKVKRRHAEQALERLRHVRANVLGAVVNG